ncbi:hypothetical protein PTE30175_04410 [Pandoraea terrae]|uniref:Uncharacterized protein n=1 Tax=Pandoraea terrae TaxID=1537710 RepID=A0A5E4YHJ4_9BURK|nr:hypothetical protein [Pandoraea terrae]VVE47930.1 hypothetical protein PTE30175_04410 [Pandoraea terrae]
MEEARHLPPDDEIEARIPEHADDEIVRLCDITSRIVALAAIGGQGSIASLDDKFIYAFFEQMEDLSKEAHDLADIVANKRFSEATAHWES